MTQAMSKIPYRRVAYAYSASPTDSFEATVFSVALAEACDSENDDLRALRPNTDMVRSRCSRSVFDRQLKGLSDFDIAV